MNLFPLLSLFILTSALPSSSPLDSSSSSTLAPRAGCSKQGYEYTNCCVEYGVDRPGGDYAKQKVDSLFKCAQLCDAAPRCRAASYHTDSGFCYFKDRVNNFRVRQNTVSFLCQKDSSVTACTSRPFKVKLTSSTSEYYLVSETENLDRISVTGGPDDAGTYTLSGTTLLSTTVPGAIIYTSFGNDAGPNPPPNGRALFQAIPGTLPSFIKDAVPVKVTVTDPKTCSLAFSDGSERTVLGFGGFRGGGYAYLAPPGTTGNFQASTSVNAIPV